MRQSCLLDERKLLVCIGFQHFSRSCLLSFTVVAVIGPCGSYYDKDCSYGKQQLADD